MTNEEADATISEILDKFDFEKVHAVMVLTGWKWHEWAVPTIEELREAARHYLLKVCMAEEVEVGQSTGSGGFTAYKDGGEVHLVFELETYAVTREERRLNL